MRLGLTDEQDHEEWSGHTKGIQEKAKGAKRVVKLLTCYAFLEFGEGRKCL